MDYYVWEEPGQLVTRSAEFRVGGIVPIEAGGRDLAPDYPGISNTPSLRDWDPPFPARSPPRPPDRRGLLGSVSHDAEGVRPLDVGAAALGIALRLR